jgi:LuxR family glucitol operon transcriptional activator
MSKVAEVRLTIAALIYGVENDLKSMLKTHIASTQVDFSFFRDPDLVTRTKGRFSKDNIGLSPEKSISDVIEYLDFLDILKVILKNSALLPAKTETVIKKIAPEIEKITPIRNRTMHTRPLHYGDFSTVYNFLMEIEQFYADIFPSSVIVLGKIQSDPSYILTLDYPQVLEDDNVVSHNLPLPDFDETGLIGRQKDIEELKHLIRHNQVVTLIGTGGIGKSALMLKAAYDIVDLDKQCPFDIVIWVSAKTTALTARGVEEIKDALSDYQQVIGGIVGHFGMQSTTLEENISIIMEYIDVYRTLIIIDNLETIQNESISEFIRAAQMKCKIAITSRIGLGELEYRRSLLGLSGSDCAKMIRELATVRNNRDIEFLSQDALIGIAAKLYYNPLAIKWFVNSVVLGKNPNDVLARKDDLLEFCLSNVYEKLTSQGLQVLNTIRSARRALSEAEIIFLSEMAVLECRKGIMGLLTTSFVVRDIKAQNHEQQVLYRVADFPNEYLLKHYPIEHGFVRGVQKKLVTLTESLKETQYINSTNEFDIHSLEARNSEERIASTMLLEALAFSRRTDYAKALQKVEDVKGITPNYFEVYRVSAFIKASAENPDTLGADDDYQTALELEPDNAKTLYYYARFLLFRFEDTPAAKPFADKVFLLRPDNPHVNILKAQILEGSSDFNGAVEVLADFIDNKAVKSSKEMRMAVSEIISNYQNWAQKLINIDQNYGLAGEKLTRCILFYEKAYAENNVDKNMSSKLSKSLFMLVSYLPKIVALEYQSKILNAHARFSDHLALTEYYPNLVQKIFDVFSIEVNKSVLIKDGNQNREKGIIIQYYPEKDFVFIETDNEKIFAYKDNFRNILDWSDVANGLVVVFDKKPSTAVGKSATAYNIDIALYS